jgi:hypothetical protein
MSLPDISEVETPKDNYEDLFESLESVLVIQSKLLKENLLRSNGTQESFRKKTLGEIHKVRTKE